MKQKNLLFFIVILMISSPILAQENFLKEAAEINRNGMYVLGSWALLNIATGAYGMTQATGTTKRFYEMNIYWNLVNMGLAAGGIIGGDMMIGDADGSLSEILDRQSRIEKTFLFNSALNFTYITTGILLKEMSRNSEKWKFHLSGYGNSLIVQGVFLLGFDLTMYFLHHSHANRVLSPVLENLSFGPLGMGFQIEF
jgi:hypothetical protein